MGYALHFLNSIANFPFIFQQRISSTCKCGISRFISYSRACGSFCPFCFGHYNVCPSICGIWLQSSSCNSC